MRRAALVSFFLATIFLVAAPSRADILYLTDGRKVEGEIVDQGDRYRVRLPSGITTYYPKHMVIKFERKKSSTGGYRQRKKEVEPDDAKGLLDLARWCKTQKLKTEAEQNYRAAMAVASPHYRTAKKELALMLKGQRRHKESFVLFRGLGGECARERDRVRDELDRERKRAFTEGTQLMAKNDYRRAVIEFERAFNVTPPEMKETARDSVTEEQVITQLIAARLGLAEKVGENKVVLVRCSGCAATGIGTCSVCKGRGTVKRQMMTRTSHGFAMVWRDVRCDHCKGTGKARCPECSGATVSLAEVSSQARSVLRSMADMAYPNANTRLATALRRAHRWAPTHLFGYHSGEAPYARGGGIRSAVKSIPVTSAEMANASGAWRSSDPYSRVSFLTSYTIDLLIRLACIPQGALKDDKESTPGAFADAELRRADMLSAFPDAAKGEAVRIRGVWKGLDVGAAAVASARIDIDTGGPNHVNPFVWRAKARDDHERLGEALDLSGLAARAKNYPYEKLNQTLAERRPGDRVELAGRFFYEDAPVHRGGMEGWDITARPSDEVERAIAYLSRRVTFHFDNTPLDAAVEMLGELAGVTVQLNVPQDLGLTVTSRQRGVTLGAALEAILGPLELSWTPNLLVDSAVKIGGKLSAEEKETVQQVLRLLPK